MISRSATKLIAKIYGDSFALIRSPHDVSVWLIDKERLYDFLYERDYDTSFLNAIEKAYFNYPRTLIEFIMKVHTGESLILGTQSWTQGQREKLGQRYLKDLAEDIIEYCEVHSFGSSVNDMIEKLKSQLELDGYSWNSKSKKLLFSEASVLDLKEEQGILKNLTIELSLANQETVFHHLGLSEEHYINGKWDDSISNSRKFLEAILKEVAARYSMITSSKQISRTVYESPQEVRDYLEQKGLIESKEKKAIASTYQLLSDTGGHPYIAQKDQARLLRHVALTYSQFVMLRLKGYQSQLAG